jgi:hypothetical protein
MDICAVVVLLASFIIEDFRYLLRTWTFTHKSEPWISPVIGLMIKYASGIQTSKPVVKSMAASRLKTRSKAGAIPMKFWPVN